MFQGVPRALIAFGVVTIAVLEIATRLPDILLLPEKIDAALGEYKAKSLQPKVVTTQVEKTEADTRLADAQTQLNAVQQAKTAAETRVAQLQAEVTAAQVAKTKADTELTRMQTTLAATQAQKTQADTQLAQAQTDKTRLDTAQEGVGLALTAGIVGMGAKLFGAMSQSQDTQHATSADYTDGVNARNRWNLWLSGLSGSTREGAKFWENVRNDGRARTCAEGKGWSNADFRSGCEEAKNQLAAVDQYGMTRSDFRAGWDADRGTQQRATTQQATAPAVPQQQAVLPRRQEAPVTGPALLTTSRFITLANSADAAVALHNCASAVHIYNEGMKILDVALPESATVSTVEQRTQAMRILALRNFINNPQNCPNGPTVQ